WVRSPPVVRVVRSHRQRVPHDDPPGRRLPRGLDDVRARDVDACAGMVDAVRAKSEHAGFAVEQAAKDAGRVERRHTEPVPRTVQADERTGVAVRYEGVVGDLWEGRE